MDPCVWGPPLWRLMHGTAAREPRRAQAAVLACLYSMRAVLPCRKCRESLTAILAGLEGMHFPSVFEVTWMVHNYVNRKLGKPPLSLRRARRLWAVMSAPGDPVALADALVIIDANYGAYLASQAAYKQFWRATAALCQLTPSMR